MTDIERLKRYKSLYERNCEYDVQVTSNAEDQADIKEVYYKNIHTFDNAIAALEKQIPKKAKVHGFREGREINTISFTCPMCNEHIGRDRYCKHCGQALDWSDTE